MEISVGNEQKQLGKKKNSFRNCEQLMELKINHPS